MLFGCAVEPSTATSFDDALLTLENGMWQEINVTLKNEANEICMQLKSTNGTQKSTAVLSSGQWESVLADSLLARFCQGDLLMYAYENFSEEQEAGIKNIYFDVPQAEFALLEDAFQLSLNKVSGEMKIDQDDGLKQILSLSTKQGNYQLLLDVEGTK